MPHCLLDHTLMHVSSAELVYGAPLTVPGSFFTRNTVSWSPLDPLNIPKTVPTSSHGNTKTHVPDDLFSTNMCSSDMIPTERHSNAHLMVHTKLLP